MVTSLYANPVALHLYIPPHLCHAPGVLPGIVFGNVLRIHKLCTRAELMSPKKSSSSSTASWIMGINWPSSPHFFDKQWTMSRPIYGVLSSIVFAQSQRREKDSINILSPPPVPPHPEALVRTCSKPQGSTSVPPPDK